MLVRVAVCDDVQRFNDNLCERLNEYFNKKDIMLELLVFLSAQEMLEKSNDVAFDVLFLDIDMPGMSGIEAAEIIRRNNEHIAIIFVTNRDDLVFESIKYKPFRFLRKDMLTSEFDEALIALEKRLEQVNANMEFATPDGIINLRITEIKYLEVIGHNVYIYYHDKKIDARGALNKFEEDFSRYGFIRIHSGYLVNFRYIYLVGKTDVVLDSGEKLPLSRRKYDDVVKRYQLLSRQGKGVSFNDS